MSSKKNSFKRGCTEFLTLYILSQGDLYGYQIAQLITEKSGGLFIMHEETLYIVLHKMVDDGYISTYNEAAGKRRIRKYYRLEPAGKEYLDKTLREYDKINQGISLVLDRNEKADKEK